MAAHWVSAKFTGYDGEGRAGIVYEGADLVGGMQYFGILGDYLTGIKGTAISAESPTGSIMLPPEYAGKTITLNLCGGAIVPNVIVDSISVAISLVEPTPPAEPAPPTAVKPAPPYVPRPGEVGIEVGSRPYHAAVYADDVHVGRTTCIWFPDTTKVIRLTYPGYEECIITDIPSEIVKTTIFDTAGDNALVRKVYRDLEKSPEPCSQDLIIRFTNDPTKVADCFYTIKGGTPNIPAKSATPFTIQCPENQTVRINVGVTEDTIDSFTDFYACTDKVEEIPLLVGAPPGEAFLTLTVVDKDNLPIEGATVTVDGATGTTDASGMYKTTAVIGTELTVTVTKDGYEPGTLTDTMLEGGLPIKIMLVKIGELITQLIIVKKAGEFQEEYIEGATVTVDGKTCEGLPDGLYSVEIEEGIEATVEVIAEGYKDKTETFTTTSMATLMIELEPAVPEGESEQEFTLVDVDGNPIEGATITVGEESCITDSEGKCVITAPIGEETTATITKPGYEDTTLSITPEEGGNEYAISMPKAEELLTLPAELEDDLNNETLSPEIKAAFEAAGIPLSDAAVVEKIDDNTWKVTDGEDVYSVVKEDGKLNVYPGGVPPAPPEPPTPPPGEMLQLIIVHEEGIFPFKYITGATVKVDGTLCIDEGEGHYSINLTIGATVTATIEKDGYETVEHAFTVTEGQNPVIPLPLLLAADRFEITITNLDVVTDVKTFAVGCFTPSPLPIDWLNLIGAKQVAYKKLSRYDPTETVIFQESDGLIVGHPYVFRQGREFYAPIVGDFFINLGAGMIGLGEGAELRGVQRITVDARSLEILTLPMPLQWLCSTLGVADCTAFLAETGVELFITQHAWKCRLEGTDVHGNPCSPTAFDDMWIGIDIIGIIPFGMLAKSVGGIGKFAKALKGTGNIKWLDDAANVKLFLKAESASDATAMGNALRYIEVDDMAGFTKWCNDAIAAGKSDDMARAMAKAIDEGGTKFTSVANYEVVLRNGHVLDAWIEVITDALKGQDAIYIKKLLDDIVTPKNITIIEKNLVKFPTEFKEGYALHRFLKPEFITALKEANQFDAIKATLMSADSDELLKASAKGFTDDELTAIYKNLDDAGATELTTKLKSILKIFDFDEMLTAFMKAVADGDWVKAKGEWIKFVNADPATVVKIDGMLTGKPAEFQRLHNIMRFSKIDYVDALADANRLTADLDFMARHLGDIGEPYNYITVWKALDPTEKAHVFANIDGAGRKNLAKIIDLLGADTSKGTKVHATAATKKLDDLGEMTEDEVRAASRTLSVETDEAAKSATTAEKAAAAKMVETDDPVKHPKLARLWAHLHRQPKTAELIKETGAPSFKKLPLWAKLSLVGFVYMGANTIWKHMMDFCMALFMGEETIQWAGFGGIVLNSMTYDWDEKPLSERKEIIATFKKFRDLRGGMHETVTTASGIFETLCLVFGDIYRNFWEADKISIWALDQKIADMEKGIDPLSGIGECTVLASADKKGVAFYVHGETKKYHSGASYDVVKVPDVLVRDEEYKVVLCAEKDGYVLGIQQIRITRDDIGERISTPTFELIPDSDIGVNPFSGLPYTDEEYNKYAEKPTKYGKIICSTNPTGAKIYLDGVYKDVDTNWTLDYVPVGTHKITFKLEGYFDCEKVVNVVIEPHAQAFCYLETAEGSIRCKRMAIDHYKDRAADLFYKKHADVDWIKNPQSAPTDGGVEYIEDLEVGAEYDVKYNFLDVLECINGEVLTIPPNVPVDCDDCQLASRLPREITTTVTEVIDGDSFRTVYTDALPRRPYGGELVPQEVRIIGCNAYEIGSPIGQVAKAKLTELIGGKSVTLKIDSNRPLGVYNRVIASVFLPDGTDVAIKMMEACVIREYPGDTAKYRYAYYWEPWLYLDAVWARYDPEGNNCIASQDDTGKTLVSMSVDTATKKFKINNRWLPVYAVVRRYKGAEHVGTADEYASKAILTGETSSSYGYYDANVIKLFASVAPITIKNEGVEIETIIIGEAPPDTYPVTFTSSPAGANVIVTPGTLSISRLTSVLRSQRDSTPISRFAKRQRFK
jgi:endonuclease YncB( thermonuclease family)/RNase P/RNase MRP subunit p29